MEARTQAVRVLEVGSQAALSMGEPWEWADFTHEA